jgi:hypothetical protein
VYLKFLLTDVLISAQNLSGQGDEGEFPLETDTFTFAKVCVRGIPPEGLQIQRCAER